jgi:AraC-like DNA-binding protein
MLKYLEMSPEHQLRSYVRKFWILDNSISGLPATIRYALPNTCFTLAFIWGNGLMVDFPDKAVHMTSGSYLVGELTTKIGVTVLPYTKAFMVQLNPWTAGILSKCSFHELTNQFAPIVDLNKALAQSIDDINILDNTGSKQQISKVLERFLYPTPASAFITSCFDLFHSHPTAIPFRVPNLSSPTGYTIRGIEKKFKQHVGLTPSQAFAIIKVRSVVNELIVSSNQLSLTALAYKYGYTDQSHFTKTYSRIMESLPSKFDQRQYILPLQK